jgi:hypothetical protein
MKLIPSEGKNRFVVLCAILSLIIAGLAAHQHDWGNSAGFTVISLLLLYLAYTPEARSLSSETAYSDAIKRVATISESIETLGKFLKNEHLNIEKTRILLKQLSEERDTLSHAVKTDRETVDGILKAFQERSKFSIWKERIIAFILGVFASLIASFAYASLTSK